MDLIMMFVMVAVGIFALSVAGPYSFRRMCRNNFALVFALATTPIIMYLFLSNGGFTLMGSDFGSVGEPTTPDMGMQVSNQPTGGTEITPTIQVYNYENESNTNFSLSFEDTLDTEDLLGGI